MAPSFRSVIPLLALSLLLAACGPDAQASTSPTAAPTSVPTAEPTALPTATPEPTVVPVLAENVRVAGVNVGGLTLDGARAKIAEDVTVEAFQLYTGAISATVEPDQIGLAPALDDLLAEAEDAKAGERVPLKLSYDQAKLRGLLETIAEDVKTDGSGLDVIRDTELVSTSFVLAPAASLDVDNALEQVGEHVQTPDYTEPLTLELTLDDAGDARPTTEDLQRELEAMADQLDGVTGVYIHDVASDKELASLNKNTAFSTASTIKVAIMLNAYAHVDKFTTKQQRAMEKMIIESDNLKANDVLAAAAGGSVTEDAFVGAQQMSDMLAELGMPTTYQYTPFEANDFIKLYKPKYTLGPKTDGEPPYTESSRVQRTTPREMAEIYRLIEQCSRGEGKLVETFPKTLDETRCNEMIDLLKRNADKTRMVSGLPKGADVAHKSGWAQPDLQGDAGIVRSPGGDFIISVYFYQKGEKYSDRFVQRLLGNFTRLAYTYYNPAVVIEK